MCSIWNLGDSQLEVQEPQCDMEVDEDHYKEYFEHIMGIAGWNYPLNERDAFDLFQSFKQLQVNGWHNGAPNLNNSNELTLITIELNGYLITSASIPVC